MKSPTRRLAEARSEVSQSFVSELERQKNQKAGDRKLEVNWPQAMEKMYLNNPQLIQADSRIEDARESQLQVWKRMIPGFGVGISDSFELGVLADAFSDPTLRVTSYLSLGNLLGLPKEVYTQKLYYMGAELQAENTMRQEVIALYRIFRQQSLLLLEKRALDLEQQLISDVSGLEGSEVLTMQLQQREAFERWEQNHLQWRSKASDFFMSNYDEIKLDERELPDIRYYPKDLDFSDTNRWGLLQLNLLALEQIAEDGRITELYFRYLPRATFTVSAPPLYSNTNSQGFRIDDMRISSGSNWRLDTTGSISRQLQRIRSNQVISDWRKDKRRHEEIAELLEGKEALAEIQAELTKHRKAMDGYRKAVTQGLVKDPRSAIQTMRKLREREVRLAAKEIEICSSFWLIDEKRWKSITRRWLETRQSRAKKRDSGGRGDTLLPF